MPNGYFFFWNLIHSEIGESVINYVMKGSWKSPDVSVQGVPETLVRTESMPYSFGYSFCARVMRDWGLDGLDYFYDHPLVSSTQVMHPEKAWEWREFPVQIDLPENLAGGSLETIIAASRIWPGHYEVRVTAIPIFASQWYLHAAASESGIHGKV